MKILLLDAVKADLVEIAATRPDHVYADPDGNAAWTDEATCVYFDNALNPSCIVGEVFAREGIAYEDLYAVDEVGDKRTFNSDSIEMLANRCFAVDSTTEALLTDVQSLQDCGVPWGAAVAAALAAADGDDDAVDREKRRWRVVNRALANDHYERLAAEVRAALDVAA